MQIFFFLSSGYNANESAYPLSTYEKRQRINSLEEKTEVMDESAWQSMLIEKIVVRTTGTIEKIHKNQQYKRDLSAINQHFVNDEAMSPRTIHCNVRTNV